MPIILISIDRAVNKDKNNEFLIEIGKLRSTIKKLTKVEQYFIKNDLFPFIGKIKYQADCRIFT